MNAFVKDNIIIPFAHVTSIREHKNRYYHDFVVYYIHNKECNFDVVNDDEVNQLEMYKNWLTPTKIIMREDSGVNIEDLI